MGRSFSLSVYARVNSNLFLDCRLLETIYCIEIFAVVKYIVESLKGWVRGYGRDVSITTV